MRFALEFSVDKAAGDIARTQVERHKRMNFAATAGRDTMVTLAGSEPLLAEAAYKVMRGTLLNPVCHLANHPDLIWGARCSPSHHASIRRRTRLRPEMGYR